MLTSQSRSDDRHDRDRQHSQPAGVIALRVFIEPDIAGDAAEQDGQDSRPGEQARPSAASSLCRARSAGQFLPRSTGQFQIEADFDGGANLRDGLAWLILEVLHSSAIDIPATANVGQAQRVNQPCRCVFQRLALRGQILFFSFLSIVVDVITVWSSAGDRPRDDIRVRIASVGGLNRGGETRIVRTRPLAST